MQKNISLGESMNTTSKKIKVECEEVPIVNIPSKIFSDVYYLHSKYPGKEWSGHLYFSKKGDITNPSELVIDIQEFVLLDLGTAGATEIDPTGEQIMNMYESRPQVLSLKQGLLHTHHNMRTFFSGTDWDTLLENASNYDFFLSVIVNNEGATIAKISLQGFIEEAETTNTYKYKFNRGFLEKEIIKEKKITEVIYVYTCKINIENNVDEEFNKLLEIKENQRLVSIQNNAIGRTFYDRTVSHNGFEDDWGDSRVRKQHPRDPDFKVKNHKQIELPFGDSILDTKLQIPTTKDLTLNWLTSLLLQDDDFEYTFTTTYRQAIEQWEEELGIESLPVFTTYVEEIVEDVFNNIFGDEIELEELEDIKLHVSIILGNSPQELAIKPIVNNYLNSIK